MAKRKVDNENQMVLIETTHPAHKKFKAAKNAYNKFLNEKNDAAGRADKKREEILQIIREDFKVSPDVDGVIKFTIDGVTTKITPGKSKLNFTEENAAPEEDAVEAEEIPD